MAITCPIDIPQPRTAKTPKAKIGLINATKFRAYLVEGLGSGSLLLHNGYLNRMVAAEQVGFGRSAYAQNEYIAKLAVWADSMVAVKQRNSPGKTKNDLEAAREADILRKRNVELRAALDEADGHVSELNYIEKMIARGEVKLPW